MSSEWVIPNASSITWLCVYGLAAVSLAVGLFRVGLRPAAGAGASARFWALGLLALGVLPALDLGETLGASFSGGGKFVVQAALLLVGFGLGATLLRLAYQSASVGRAAFKLRGGVCLLVLAVPTLLWASHRVFGVEADEFCENDVLDLPLPSAENLREVAEVYLQTDRGTRIPVFRLIGEEASRDVFLEQLERHAPSQGDRAILKSRPETHSNCHGWVFAAGQFIIRGQFIDRILEDNAYQPVEAPETGDLIVYRDADGAVLHTGVVKATGRDGFLLVESKWGFFGNYLHEPQHQGYSQAFAFYRSPRRGHRLQDRLNNRPKPLRAPVSARLHPLGAIV